MEKVAHFASIPLTMMGNMHKPPARYPKACGAPSAQEQNQDHEEAVDQHLHLRCKRLMHRPTKGRKKTKKVLRSRSRPLSLCGLLCLVCVGRSRIISLFFPVQSAPRVAYTQAATFRYNVHPLEHERVVWSHVESATCNATNFGACFGDGSLCRKVQLYNVHGSRPYKLRCSLHATNTILPQANRKMAAIECGIA